MGTCSPVGTALPPRRDAVLEARDVSGDLSPAPSSGWGDSINVPLARDRMLEYFEREQLPGDIKSTLAAALNGDLDLQSLLFTAMLDTWPRLQKNINEIARLVSVAPWKIHAFAKRGEKPDAAAEKLAKEVENLVWTMRPRAVRLENSLEGTIKALVRAYYYGHGVLEIRWEQGHDGEWKPRCTKEVPARYYGYPYEWAQGKDPEDRLMFDREGGLGSRSFIDFPEHRFLVGINRGHGGHAAVAAPLRALAAYWLAAVYGLKWFINFSQLYGIPWRHAEVGDSKDENAVKAALASIGSHGYITTKPGVKINILESSKGGDALPQKALVDLADQQCDTFILGQTLTGGTDKSGSRALGEVHQGTLDGVVDGVADFVGEILTHQFVPAVISVNWGDRPDLPEMWARREEKKDEKAANDAMEARLRMGIPMSEAFVYEMTCTPIPAAGDKLFEPVRKENPAGVPDPDENESGKPGNPDPSKEKPGIPSKDKKPVEAADASDWVSFPSSSGSLGIPRREMPQIRSGDRAAMVQFLRARGIESRAEVVTADSLRATQAEFSPAKVHAASIYQGENRAILISEDDHVVDGHHQWLASVERDEPISVIRLMAPIARVLMMVHRMPSTTVAAADAPAKPLTVDQLSDAVLEGLTGVSREWLSPVRPFFERLAALAMSKHVSDEDFAAALESAQARLPELFDLLDTEALETAFNNAIGSAALAGSTTSQES